MANILVHIHSGPELKNKLTLGLLVAKTAVAEGHKVKLFMARGRSSRFELQIQRGDSRTRYWRC